MAEILTLEALPLQAIRPKLTTGVFGETLLEGSTRIVLTRLDPGGSFTPHSDLHGHLFLGLEGTGLLQAGAEQHAIGPGSVVRLPAGETHGYRNTGDGELRLLSVNLPVPDPG